MDGNKITNVAPGEISSTSTEAVNGSQLYMLKAEERHIRPTNVPTGSRAERVADQTVFITHGDCIDDANYLADLIRKEFGTAAPQPPKVLGLPV